MFEKISKFFISKKNIQKIKEVNDKFVIPANNLEKEIINLTDEDIKKKINFLKKNYLSEINPKLSDKDIILCIAIVREVSRRTLGLRHFDCQVIGAICLYYGFIAEMKTGEGKTLVATITAFLNYIEQSNTHLVTVNDYLAKRDSEWMNPIYEFLGMSNAFIENSMEIEEKRKYREETRVEFFCLKIF